MQETLEEECKAHQINIADLEKALESALKVSAVGLSNTRNSSVIFQIPSNFLLPDRNGKPFLIQQIKQRIRWACTTFAANILSIEQNVSHWLPILDVFEKKNIVKSTFATSVY